MIVAFSQSSKKSIGLTPLLFIFPIFSITGVDSSNIVSDNEHKLKRPPDVYTFCPLGTGME